MTDDEDDEVLALLDDEYARSILIETSTEPMSVDTLTDRCEASPPTIYRRIERLEDHDFLESHQELDPDGHHYKTYSARLEHVSITVADGAMDIEIHRREEDPADRFTRLFEEL